MAHTRHNTHLSIQRVVPYSKVGGICLVFDSNEHFEFAYKLNFVWTTVQSMKTLMCLK